MSRNKSQPEPRAKIPNEESGRRGGIKVNSIRTPEERHALAKFIIRARYPHCYTEQQVAAARAEFDRIRGERIQREDARKLAELLQWAAGETVNGEELAGGSAA